jgi:predicted transcriptional regulator
MNLFEVKELLNADVLAGEEILNTEVSSAFACDLLSDVLAYVEDKSLLLTGLVNMQTIRTAEMMDIEAIVFVRGKKPNGEILELAKENNMVILSTKHILYTSCGILHKQGLRGAKIMHK